MNGQVPLTAGNIEWEPHINNFSVHRKAIQDPKKNDDSTLPNTSKTVRIEKWFEANEYHASQVIGQAKTPLTWIIHDNVAVASIAPALEIGQTH